MVKVEELISIFESHEPGMMSLIPEYTKFNIFEYALEDWNGPNPISDVMRFTSSRHQHYYNLNMNSGCKVLLFNPHACIDFHEVHIDSYAIVNESPYPIYIGNLYKSRSVMDFHREHILTLLKTENYQVSIDVMEFLSRYSSRDHRGRVDIKPYEIYFS